MKTTISSTTTTTAITTGSGHSVTVIVVGNGIGNPSTKQDAVISISLCANVFEKGINPLVLDSAISKLKDRLGSLTLVR